MPGLSRQAAVAGRVPLPDMQRAGSLGHGAGLTSLPRVRSANLGDCGNLVRGHAFAVAAVVRSALARDQPEKRGQRPGPAAGVGSGAVSYTHLRAHETRHDLVCRLLLEK